MSNSLFEQYGGMPNRNIIQEFLNFRKSMQGKNPQEEINKLLRQFEQTRTLMKQFSDPKKLAKMSRHGKMRLPF